jgi:tRNA(fMet)-specific endonuclease VapC
MAKKKHKVVLLDTNILIAILKGHSQETQEFDDFITGNRGTICTISILELYYGMFKHETKQTKGLVSKLNKFHLDKEICMKAMDIMLAYPTMRPSLPDCLIAATAIVCNCELYTHNVKDFDYIKGVKLYKPQLPK